MFVPLHEWLSHFSGKERMFYHGCKKKKQTGRDSHLILSWALFSLHRLAEYTTRTDIVEMFSQGQAMCFFFLSSSNYKTQSLTTMAIVFTTGMEPVNSQHFTGWMQADLRTWLSEWTLKFNLGIKLAFMLVQAD